MSRSNLGAVYGMPLVLFAALSLSAAASAAAQSLSGKVTSTEEGAMEGVIVSAHKKGSTITTSVVSDARGTYAFPSGRLPPGEYDIRIRAAGYDLDGAGTTSLGRKDARVDLALKKTTDLVSQLTNAELIEGMPGTLQQKTYLQNCVTCHTLQRVVHSKYTSDDFLKIVLPRMQGYVNQSKPGAPQLRKAERLMEERGDSRVQIYKAAADYLATVNQSKQDGWSYPARAFARPKGRATKVIYTEYDLPREEIQPHDVILDGRGHAWYSSFGEQFIGRIDTRTGAHAEFPVPIEKPGFPTGSLSLRADKSGTFWFGNMYQGTLYRLDPKTAKMTPFKLPPEVNVDQAQLNMSAPGAIEVDHRIWAQNNGFAGVHRLDLVSGKWETWEPYKGAKEPHNIYDVVADSKNNVFFTDFRWRNIGRIDAKTGKVEIYEIPTANANPRRAEMDAKDRLWFGEYRGHRIGMFDTRTLQFKEWALPTPWSAPYDVTLDRTDHAWTGSMLTDRVARLDAKTGEVVEYLTPRSTNIRRTYVDDTTKRPTFWAGNNHGASILKVEPQD